MKFTGNIYNDFHMYKHKDIFKRVQCMMLNSTKDNVEKYHNTKVSLYYELDVLVKDELDPITYKYDTLYAAITAVYFLNLLTQKEGYDYILDYKIHTIVKDGSRDREIIVDVTDNFHYWLPIEIDTRLKTIKEQERELELYREFLAEFGYDLNKVEEYFEEKTK